MKVELAFPTAISMIRLLKPAEPASDSAAAAHDAVARFIKVIWPVMGVHAKEQGVAVSEDTWNAINTLDLAEAFVNSHPSTPEADELRAYLNVQLNPRIPEVRTMARLQYSVTVMKIDKVLKQLKKAAA